MVSQNKLVSSIRQGDVTAFKQFFESFYPSLLSFAGRYLHDRDDSLDIVQDAFIYIWNKRSDLLSIPAARAYLYKYVKNRSLNLIRDNQRKMVLEGDPADKDIFFRDLVIEEETYRIIHQAIRGLSPQSQRVIELTLDGLSNSEIAGLAGISVNTVKTIKLRAFRSLRNEFGDLELILFFLCLKNNPKL